MWSLVKSSFRSIVFLFLLSLVLCPKSLLAVENEQAFYEILENVRFQVKQVAAVRPYKIAAMNNSIDKMSQAIEVMSFSDSASQTLSFLDQAKKEYPANYFVDLFRGIIYEAQSNERESLDNFEIFLIKSRSYSDFERAFISWREFHFLRRIIYEKLTSAGVSFEGREKDIQVRIPFEAFAEYLKNPEKEDQILNGIFVMILVLGIPLLILCHFMEADFSSFWISTFVVLYFTTWVAYIGWMADLLVGLPFLISRWKFAIFIYVTVFFFHFIKHLTKYFSKRFQPIEEGYRRCPNCSEVVQKILKECPSCRKTIN